MATATGGKARAAKRQAVRVKHARPRAKIPKGRERYHYVDSGLVNVWLANGFRRIQTPYGEAVSIEDIEGLHSVLGHALVSEKPRLSGAEFRFLRKELCLSQELLGEIFGVQGQTVALWEKRKGTPVPEHADRLVRLLYLNERDPKSKIRELVSKLKELDDRQFELIAEETKKGWHAKAA